MTKRTKKMSENTKAVGFIALCFFYLVCLIFYYPVRSDYSDILRYEEIEDSLKSYDTQTAENIILRSESEGVKWQYFNTKSTPGREDNENFKNWTSFWYVVLKMILIAGGIAAVIIFALYFYYKYQEYKKRQEAKKKIKVHRKDNRLRHFRPM